MATDYQPLTDFLTRTRVEKMTMPIKEVERVLGQSLPASARRHQAWWANTTTHSHSRAWMSAGWRTIQLNLQDERVTFVREQACPDPTPAPVSAAPVGETVLVERPALGLGVLKMIADRIEAGARNEGEGIVAILEEAALDQRRKLLARFAEMSPRLQGDSTDLIREDRDAR